MGVAYKPTHVSTRTVLKRMFVISRMKLATWCHVLVLLFLSAVGHCVFALDRDDPRVDGEYVTVCGRGSVFIVICL